MSKTIALTAGNGRRVHISRRFRSTELSRLHEAAPTLVKRLNNLFLPEDEEGAQAAERALGSLKEAAFRLVSVPVSEMDALHRFCANLTARVEGFERDGAPVEWSGLEGEERLELYDTDVQHLTKVNIYLYASLLKNGIDPTAVEGAESGG